MATWLEELRAGDLVVTHNYRGRGVRKVKRLTPTQILLEGGGRFRRDSGREIGAGPYEGATLFQATDEVVAEIRNAARKRLLVERLATTKWSAYSVATLEAVSALLPQGEGMMQTTEYPSG